MVGSVSKCYAALALSLLTALSGCASTGSWFGGWFGGSNKSATASLLQSYGAKQPGPLQRLSNSVTSTVSKTFSTNKLDGAKPPDETSLSTQGKPSADFYVSVGKLQEGSGNFDGAVEQYNRALELDPNHLGALLGMALLHDRQGQFPEAAKYYREAAEKHPNQAAVLNNLGLCYARQGKFTEAATSLQQAVAAQPNKVLYRNNLANVLVETNQIDDAVKLLTPVQGAATAHYNVGYLLQKRGRNTEALTQFHQSMAADPNLVAAQTWIEQLEAGGTVAAVATTAAPQPGRQAAVTNYVSPRVPIAPAQTATAIVSDHDPLAPLPSGPRSQVEFTQSAPTVGNPVRDHDTGLRDSTDVALQQPLGVINGDLPAPQTAKRPVSAPPAVRITTSPDSSDSPSRWQ